jgi:hypothetical protein
MSWLGFATVPCPPAAIRPLPAARIAGGHARLGGAVLCFLQPPSFQFSSEFGHLFAQHGEQAVTCRDFGRELRLERGGFCRVGLARQRWIDNRQVGAGRKEARRVGADPQMSIMAQPALPMMAQPGGVVGLGHGDGFRNSCPGRDAAFFMPQRHARA